MRRLFVYILFVIISFPFTGCMEDYLDLYPEDKITSANFPENDF